MIITVTLNPAIDRTIFIRDFKVGTLNRSISTRVDAGGKGINVSKAVKALGGDTMACGFLAGSNGRFIKDSITSLGIQHDFVEVLGETRVNIKIVSGTGQYTDINEPGFDVTEADFNRLLDRIEGYFKRGNIIVISGSTPPNLPIELYSKLCKKVVDANVPLIIDADGERLKAALTLKPDIVKPNMTELSEATGIDVTDIDSALKGAKMLKEYGVKIVAVSMGSKGAIFINNEILYVEPPSVPVQGPVGAGDNLVGALAFGMSQNMNFADMARFAVACGTASTSVEGTRAASRKSVISIFEKTKVHYL